MFDSSDTASKPSRLRTMKVPLWIPLLLLVLLVAALVAIPTMGRKAEREREAAVQQVTENASAETRAAQKRAEDTVVRVSDEAHRLFGTALGWALRSAWMRNNQDELDQYVIALVRNESIRLVALADQNGRIFLASNRDLKGSQLTQHFPAEAFTGTSVAINGGEGRLRRLIVPVMGLTSQLGTAVVVYDAPLIAAR